MMTLKAKLLVLAAAATLAIGIVACGGDNKQVEDPAGGSPSAAPTGDPAAAPTGDPAPAADPSAAPTAEPAAQ